MALHKTPPWRLGGHEVQSETEGEAAEVGPRKKTNFKVTSKAGRPRANHSNGGTSPTKKKTKEKGGKSGSATVGKASPSTDDISFKIWCIPPCERIHCRDGKPDLSVKASYVRTDKISCHLCGKIPAVSPQNK